MPYKDPAVRKAKHAEYSKTYYEKNKAQIIKTKAARKKELTVQFAAFKATKTCTKCGESHPAALDFHHLISKNTNKKVYKLVSDGHHWPRILEEITKCIVLCANCHRKHHYDERVLAKTQKSSNI